MKKRLVGLGILCLLLGSCGIPNTQTPLPIINPISSGLSIVGLVLAVIYAIQTLIGFPARRKKALILLAAVVGLALINRSLGTAALFLAVCFGWSQVRKYPGAPQRFLIAMSVYFFFSALAYLTFPAEERARLQVEREAVQTIQTK